MLGREHERLGTVVDERELAARGAVAPQHDLLLATLPAFDHLADQTRDDVRRLEIEVVAQLVHVDPDEIDRVEAVLLRYD